VVTHGVIDDVGVRVHGNVAATALRRLRWS
jgi:hypothetical protein